MTAAVQSVDRAAPATRPPHGEGLGHWLRRVGVSMFDQALLSALSFGIGLVFVRLASKSEYTVYSQVTALALVLGGTAGATISTPLAALLPKSGPAEQRDLARAGFVLFALQCALMGVALGFAIWAIPSLIAATEPDIWLVAAFFLATLSGSFRDFFRNLLFIRLRPLDCLWLDVAYILPCGFGLLLLNAFARLTATSTLIVTSCVGLVFLLPWIVRANLGMRIERASLLGAVHTFSPLARWSLPALLVSFVGGSFSLLSTHVVGVDATAELVAARLFVQPLGPVFVAWTNVFRPRIAHLVVENQTARIRRLVTISALAMGIGIVLYLLAVHLAYPLLQRYVLGSGYQNLDSDILWWGLGSLVAGVAGIGTGVLIARGDFKQCFWSACAGNVASVPLLFILGNAYGKHGVLAALALGNVLSALWTFVIVARDLAPTHKERR